MSKPPANDEATLTGAAALVAPRPKKPKRVQVSRACQRCKRLQKGCSEYRPCQRCVRVGLEAECLRDVGRQGRRRAVSASETAPVAAGMVFSSIHSTRNSTDGGGARAWSSYPHLPASVSPETAHAAPLPGPLPPLVLPPLPGRSLPPDAVVRHCFQRFFARLYPTIPILSREYADVLLAEAEWPCAPEARCLVTAVCAVVLLQVEPPDGRPFEAAGVRHPNRRYGELLFENAMASRLHLTSSAFNPSLERALATFFLYAGHAALFHHSQAFFFLRETATLCLVLRVRDGDLLRRRLADRLFWIVLVSERSHGIRYRRPVTLQVVAPSPALESEFGSGSAPRSGPGSGFPSKTETETDTDTDTDTALAGLHRLVSLFRPLDTVFFSLLNREETTAFSSRPRLLASPLDAIHAAIRGALDEQPQHGAGPPLCETQLANLRVTQLWLLVVLWQLRLRLGLLTEGPGIPCHMTFHYPVELGEELAAVVRAVSVESIRVHGVGISEKIFDVACAMVDVLSRVPAADDERGAARENIRYFRRLILDLPGGESTYCALLDKHISNTLPSVLTQSTNVT
ncbi:hypothetical protein VTH06DRAFT_4661 [Thermothelomyces fergusii]